MITARSLQFTMDSSKNKQKPSVRKSEESNCTADLVTMVSTSSRDYTIERILGNRNGYPKHEMKECKEKLTAVRHEGKMIYRLIKHLHML